MTRIMILLAVLSVAACAAETGPPGGASAGGNVNPVNGSRNTGTK